MAAKLKQPGVYQNVRPLSKLGQIGIYQNTNKHSMLINFGAMPIELNKKKAIIPVNYE